MSDYVVRLSYFSRHNLTQVVQNVTFMRLVRWNCSSYLGRCQTQEISPYNISINGIIDVNMTDPTPPQVCLHPHFNFFKKKLYSNHYFSSLCYGHVLAKVCAGWLRKRHCKYLNAIWPASISIYNTWKYLKLFKYLRNFIEYQILLINY